MLDGNTISSSGAGGEGIREPSIQGTFAILVDVENRAFCFGPFPLFRSRIIFKFLS